MLNGIGHLEMRVRDLDACRAMYGGQLGLQEVAHGAGPGGGMISMFAIGDSVLELHEDPDAVTALLPSGERKDHMDVPGSVGHFALYVENNGDAFEALRHVLAVNPLGSTRDGPSVQAMDHEYMQRSLLELYAPGGYVIQIAEVLDPREHVKDRIMEKKALAAAAGGGLLRGIDHVNINCTDVTANRDLFVRTLGLDELCHRTEKVPPVEGFEESVIAAGLTDLEISQSDGNVGRRLGLGAVTSLGFWTDDVEGAYRMVGRRGLDVGEPPSELAPLPNMRRRAFSFEGLDGLRLEVAQRG
jgi:catechol 2,3-dioxygenase-like lactoylglutathione lyase family enzyme